MSLLNDMLHDLDRRTPVGQQAIADVYELFGQPAPEPEPLPSRSRYGFFVSVFVLVVILATTTFTLWPHEPGMVAVVNNPGTGESGVVPRPVIDPRLILETGPFSPVSATREVLASWPLVAEYRFEELAGAGHPVVAEKADESQQAYAQSILAPTQTLVSPFGAAEPIEKPDTVLQVSEEEVPDLVELSGRKMPEVERQATVTEPDDSSTHALVTNSDRSVQDVGLRQARLLAFRGDRSEAKQRLWAVLDEAPGSDDVQTVLAGWLIQDQDWPAASRLLADVNKNSSVTHRLLRARTLLASGTDTDIALAVALLGAGTRPGVASMPDYYELLASLYQKSGRHADAALVWQELAKSNPANGQWWAGLAVSLDQAGQWRMALDAYRQVMQRSGAAPELVRYARQRISLLSRWEG